MSNSEIFCSVSVSASVTVINSEKIRVGIGKAQHPPITDMATDRTLLITDRVTDITNGFLGFRWGSGNNLEFGVRNE